MSFIVSRNSSRFSFLVSSLGLSGRSFSLIAGSLFSRYTLVLSSGCLVIAIYVCLSGKLG